MSHLVTHDQAKRDLGIGSAAFNAAIERGDLVVVELEGLRGSTKKYVTSASLQAWVKRMNCHDPNDSVCPTNSAQDDPTPHVMQAQIASLSFHLRELAEKVDMAISRMANRQELDRRTRLRHTVSSKIGDAFDPHGFYVYLLWGDDDQTPLYIGQSRNVISRLGSHMSSTEKRNAIKSIQLIRCSGIATMNRTEAALIREYNPPLNTVFCRSEKGTESA